MSGAKFTPVLVHWQRNEEGDKVQLLNSTDKDADADSLSSDQDPKRSQPRSQHSRDHALFKTPTIVYVISFFSIIGGFLFGYDTGVIAGALLELDEEFGLDATHKELVVSVTVAAAALGALGGAGLNEKLGRKRSIMIASAIFFVGALIMAGAPPADWGWTIVLAGRFVVGLGIGKQILCVNMGIHKFTF